MQFSHLSMIYMKNSITHSSLKVSSFSDDALTFVVCLSCTIGVLVQWILLYLPIIAYWLDLMRLKHSGQDSSTTFSNLPFLKQTFRRIQAEEDKNLEHFN